jgi:iron-sulfur cluster repair protein YtfE (RIC family)
MVERIPPLPRHLDGLAMVHAAMRRDARRLVAVAPRVSAATAGVVGAWFQVLFDMSEWHHRAEDDVLFPELRRIVPGFPARERVLAYDHVTLDHAMAEIAAALAPDGDTASLPRLARRLHTVLFEHLNLEETVVFPVLTEIPVRTYRKVERRMLRDAPRSLHSWMFERRAYRRLTTAFSTLNSELPEER